MITGGDDTKEIYACLSLVSTIKAPSFKEYMHEKIVGKILSSIVIT